MRRAIVAGAIVGGFAGYVEAAIIVRFSKLYFTAPGKIGLLLVAAAMYAAFGIVATVILSRPWLLLRPRDGERAASSSAVLSIALLYSTAFLLSHILLSRSGVFSARVLLWGAGLFAASIIVACLAGGAWGALRKRRWGPAVATCTVIAVTIWAFLPGEKGAQPRGDLPDVVLVTIDTIRADHIKRYGHARIETPTMDRLASEGVLFENAVCQIPITNPSHLSLLSSRYPHQTGVFDNRHRRPPSITTIIDELKNRGYQTAAFVSSFTLDSRFGFAEGFDIYDDDSSRIKGCQSLSLFRVAGAILRGLRFPAFRRLALERDAGVTNKEAFSWLRRCARSPFFLWIHYFDPHGPYSPPSPYSEMYYSGVKDNPNNRSLEGKELPGWINDMPEFTDVNYPIAQYGAEITYTDAELDRLVEALDEKIGEEYIMVVVGDHGENLTDHGDYFTHGHHLYDEQVRVPLIIRRKGHLQPALVSSVVENVDVAPTILEIAGIEIPECYQGESLLPLMRGEEPREEKGALSETELRKGNGTLDIAYRTERYKFIKKPGEGVELYDLKNDPHELRDISKERRDLVKTFEERISSVLEEQVEEASTVVDRETQDKLRSLGYLK